MNEVIGSVLPTAVAVALSPIPIVAVIVMLGTPRARTNGPAFAVAWVLGLSVVMAAVLLVFGGRNTSDAADTSVRWGTLVLGVLMLWLAARQWRKRPRRGQDVELPGWVAQVDAFTWIKAFASGVVLSAVNPKNLALTLAASGAIAVSGLDGTDETLAAAAFVAIASSNVIALVLVALVAPRAAARPLSAIRQYMAANSAVIMAVILLLLAAKLIGDALGG